MLDRTVLIGVVVATLAIGGCTGDTIPDTVSSRGSLDSIELLVQDESYAEAESTLVSWEQQSPLSAEALVVLARAQIGLFEDDKAIRRLREALQLEPARLSARIVLIRALQRIGDLDEATRVLEASGQQEHPHIRYEAGQIALKAGQFEEALNHFEQTVAADPSMIEALYGLGTAYSRLGRDSEARSVLSRYEELAAVAEDVKIDQQILDLNPNSAEAHYNLARAFEQQGDDARALNYYQEALEIDPAFREAYNNMGILHFRAGEHEKAITAFNNALLLSDTTAKYHFNLGAVYASQGNMVGAEQRWKEALRLDPDYDRARSFLNELEEARRKAQNSEQ